MGNLAPRLLLLAMLGGGVILWGQLRRPRDLRVELDLAGALPGEIVEVDLVVRRGDRALARTDQRFGAQGAPGLLAVTVHAPPGAAEVEATLMYSGKPAHRTRARVELADEVPARVHAE